VTTTKKKPSGRQSKQQPLVLAQRRVERFALSECSRLYLQALVDPYTVNAGQACIPDDNDVPSYKALFIARGTTVVGTQGTGFVFVNPLVAANNSPGAVKTTTALYVTAGIDFSAAAGVLPSVFATMPYTQAQLGPGGVLSRTVGCGLRIRYLGNELNRSGRCIPYQAPNVWTGSAGNGSATVTYLNRPEVPSIAVDRKWHSVVYLPTASNTASGLAQSSYTYLASGATDGTGTTTTTLMSLGWVIDGATAGQSFEWECYIHKEYISDDGALVPPQTTRSHSDGPGLSAVRNAVESDIPIGDGPSYYRQALDYIASYSPSDISHVSDAVTKMAGVGKALGYL